MHLWTVILIFLVGFLCVSYTNNVFFKEDAELRRELNEGKLRADIDALRKEYDDTARRTHELFEPRFNQLLKEFSMLQADYIKRFNLK